MCNEWITNLQSELDKINPSAELQKQKKQCIYRVPKFMRDLNKDAYTPELVSFGPYHHGQDHLKPMEQYKRLALSNYLKRADITLEQVAEAMSPEVQDLMDSYDRLEGPWTDADRFLELMILDGCFLLDLMIWGSLKFRMQCMEFTLLKDMVRLENQLPLNVLAILIEVGGHKIDDSIKFIKYYRNTPEQLENIRGMGLHHLDISRKQVTIKGDYFYDLNCDVRPATELFQAGVHFVLSESDSLADISFSNGVLRLPFRTVHDGTVSLLLNYIAYEQILNVDNVVTSYAFLMDDLINTAQDVALLRKKGIIRGWVGDDVSVASLFNSLTKEITLNDCDGEVNVSLKRKLNVNEKLNEYCNKRWHKWRASFIQTYLSNPWVFISLVGASVLMLLTVTQTVYTILPSYKKS